MATFYRKPTDTCNDFGFNLFSEAFSKPEQELLKYRTLAPEWAAQSGVQLTWPHAQTDWAYMLEEVTECYLRMAFEIASRTTLLIVTPEVERVRELIGRRLPKRLEANIRYRSVPTNDTWARDHAFLTVISSEGIELLDFRFNGWGGKFESALDNAINRNLLRTDNQTEPALRGKYVDCLDFELEGGSIETDGHGTLLTTAQCLLNPNRNAELDREHIEALLSERLGVNHFLWLHHGALAGDDTDSHIDTLARLCPDDTIVYVQCKDPEDAHYAELKAMEEELQGFRTKEGKPFRLVPVPLPAPIFDEDGERLPATYANYLVMDTAVLYPTYGQEEKDEAAAKSLAKVYPGRDLVPIDCQTLIRQHGSLHCATMQYPLGVFAKE